jgi:hypothetical protein
MKNRSIAIGAVACMALLSCSEKSVDNNVQPPAPQPADIVLSASHPEIYPDGYATAITATVVDESGNALGEGFVISFEITAAPSMDGAGSPSFSYPPSDDSVLHAIDIETDASGKAIIDLYSGSETGIVRIRASYTDDNHVSTEQNLIRITSFPVGSIVLSSQYNQLAPHGRSTLIYAEVFNINDEPMGEGYGIRFEITAAPSFEGADSPSFNYIAGDDSALYVVDEETGPDGRAETVLYSGNMAGEIAIKATYIENEAIFLEEDLITVVAEMFSGLRLSADEPEIPAGYNSTNIYAAAIDGYGNPMHEAYNIRFEITGMPGPYGASFIYPPSHDSILTVYEMATDTTGIAEIELFGGTTSGTVQIKATALMDTSIFTEKPLLVIVAGPAYYIEIGPSAPGYVEGDSIYFGLLAHAWDQYTNPITDPGAMAYFGVVPDTSASIISPVFPDSNGYFRTFLSYTCNHMFDTVFVTVSIEEVSDTSNLIILNIYDGHLSMQAEPSWIVMSPEDTAVYSEITVQLTSIPECPVRNGIILFRVTGCGELSGQLTDTTDIDGYAYSQFRITPEMVPEAPPHNPYCNAIIKGNLRGYPDVEVERVIYCQVVP